jgi:type II secretory pathway component PulF
MTNALALFGGWVQPWQLLLLLVVAGLVGFLLWYRKKQM